MTIENEVIQEAKRLGAELVSFADISHLPSNLSRNYPYAVLVGIRLTPGYLETISSTPDYVGEMKRKNLLNQDEFGLKEKKTDHIADEITSFLVAKGYGAFSQSERNLLQVGCYDEKNHTTPLSHKAIALLAGLGWIGRHDLLVTPEYGSAISMCTILTNAPVPTESKPCVSSRCGNCTICLESCPTGAITGKSWQMGTPREELVDVFCCTTCLKCLALCPWTQQYGKNQ